MEFRIISPDQFPFDEFARTRTQKRRRGNPGLKKGKQVRYLDLISAFDIETTRLPDIEQGIMYVWQWAFSSGFTVMGRTWDEFRLFVSRLSERIPDGVKLVVFVHNLSYEFHYLRGIYEFTSENVFALKARKILKAIMAGCLELRCSYLHSNMRLETYLDKMQTEHRKLDGSTYDYSQIRYPWTPLTEYELAYCANDVQGLVEAVMIEMEHDGDNLYTFPLTSTGYVRRDAKAAMREVSHNWLTAQLPAFDIFQMLREAFRGGNTHANRYYTRQILHDVHSADRSSSYPDIQCNCLFPVSEFFHLEGRQSFEAVMDLITRRKKAVLMRCAITRPRLRLRSWGCPYLSRDKCRQIMDAEDQPATYDNGRILQAGYLETTLTDVDLRIVAEEYVWDDIVFFDVAYARYGPLPQQLIRETIRYYRLKTELKNVAGQEVLYTKSKNKLNSIYGMMAQSPVRQSIIYTQDPDDLADLFLEANEDEAGLLEKYNRRAFLCYQWGCWVTAWARYRLEEGIRLAHQPGAEFIYCDTDSVKYLGTIDWDAYNRDRIEDSKRSGAFATDPDGITHYMGVYEQEHDMAEFATLGAKKYVYRERPDSQLVCTIAGVAKKAGGRELDRHGGLKAFRPGFTFVDAGGLEAVYNDRPELEPLEIDGHRLVITANVVLRPSTYTLGLSADYQRLLDGYVFTTDI